MHFFDPTQVPHFGHVVVTGPDISQHQTFASTYEIFPSLLASGDPGSIPDNQRVFSAFDLFGPKSLRKSVELSFLKCLACVEFHLKHHCPFTLRMATDS